MCTRKTRGPVALVGTALLTLVFSAGIAHEASAQTGYIPYYGKNKIRYNNFKWHIYTTDHFEVYYYPEIEQHLGRIVSYAESAYQQVSSDLKHDLAFKVPLMLYKTQSEFQQQNVEPSELPEGVLAFAEPYRDRMVLPIDEVDDALYRLITHELTHIFEFDIIPRSLLRRGLPLWVDEGLADYMTGYWNSFDLMTVRDAAIADTVPAMSDFQGAAFVDGRLPYNLGHAAFEFIESRWGKEGMRQFLFALRKNVIGGGESAYEEAFRLKAEEFDEQFDKYLKDRFKPFRDKERPADYGRNLAPKRDKTPFVSVVSIEPSPSGDLLAVAAGNRKEQELDIILLSTKDSKVIQNLTSGFNKDRGYEYIATPGGFRNNAVPWMSWSPAGDRIAYFARTEKMKTLILQNAVTGKVDQRIEIKTVDMPESPDISPDGKQVAFSGLEGATGDIFIVNLESREVRNITKDNFGDFAPTWSPDGKSIVYLARASGNDKLFTHQPGDGTENPAHLRHARRRRGAVHRRRHARVPVDGHRSQPAGRARSRAQRQHLQHLDPEPEDEGAAAVHRHAHRQHVARRPARHQAGADRVRHLLQGRVRHPRARARGAAAHRRVERLRRRGARTADSVPAADDPRHRARQQAQEGRLREALPGGPAASGARRHERR